MLLAFVLIIAPYAKWLLMLLLDYYLLFFYYEAAAANIINCTGNFACRVLAVPGLSPVLIRIYFISFAVLF